METLAFVLSPRAFVEYIAGVFLGLLTGSIGVIVFLVSVAYRAFRIYAQNVPEEIVLRKPVVPIKLPDMTKDGVLLGFSFWVMGYILMIASLF